MAERAMAIDFPRKKEAMRLRRGRKAEEKRLLLVEVWLDDGVARVWLDFVSMSKLGLISSCPDSGNGF